MIPLNIVILGLTPLTGESDEISQHKWIESEKADYDIGAERAIREWLQKHHVLWVAAQEPSTE